MPRPHLAITAVAAVIGGLVWLTGELALYAALNYRRHLGH